jgi:DNA-binding protein HU-beta
MNRINKSDIVKTITSKTKLSKSQANECVKVVLETVIKSLSKGDIVSFLGFGTFFVKKRGAHVGRNMKTGEAVKIPAHKIVRFLIGRRLREAISKK